MLERLELVGFKSFAERTAFDFAPGVTGVVGPNGSGKSNVVDAVRWVLGEQSARSLRGGEMTDVIFNGSASRRSLGMAEVSMTFDNRKKVLASDADQVRITRRVYRSGEGEYLINNHACRLKDVKDLFLGSGAGTDAYCIIQQGQVDVLLQTAPKERRTIFEEAAGISRFKARKTETLRRLANTDANMQRLRDILEEVEKRVRSLDLQASKARKYQEHHAELKELRIRLSMRKYHELDGALQVESAELARLKAELEEETSRSDEGERELARLEQQLSHLDATVRAQESALAEARQVIASERARQANERTNHEQTEQEQRQTRQRFAALTLKLASLAATCESARIELEQVAEQCRRQKREVEKAETDLIESEVRLTELREESQSQKDVHFQKMRDAGKLHNEAVSYKAHLDNLTREQFRLRQRTTQAAEEVASIDTELAELTDAGERVRERMAQARGEQAELRARRERLEASRDDTARRAGDLRAERSGLASRIEVLENLDRSREGLSTGVREVFEHLGQPEPGAWRAVAGMVGDLFAVRREFAPLIDLALGERAQRFVVFDANLLARAMKERGRPFSGRVSFLHLDAAPRATASARQSAALARGAGVFTQPGAHPGIVSPAELVVRCEDERFADLPARLLGNTLIVHDLVAARAVLAIGAAVRCITLAGELLEPDGTLTVGKHHAEGGIISRKSELRELRERIAEFDRRLNGFDIDLAAIRDGLSGLEGREENAARQADALNEQYRDMRSRVAQRQEKRDGLSEEMHLSHSELGNIEEDIAELRASWQRAEDEANAGDAEAAEAHQRSEELDREARELEASRAGQQQRSTDGRVALAQVAERLAGLERRQERLESDREEQAHEHGRTASRLASLEDRLRECVLAQLRATSALAAAFARKDDSERLLRELGGEREVVRARRRELAEQAQASRSTWRQRQESAHEKELVVAALGRDREAISARLREDYQIELDELYRECLSRDATWFEREEKPETGEDGEPISPDDRILELRKKLSKLGSVNLESIAELQQQETRHSGLREQFDDLAASQKVLQDIINRINGDSRRMFTETFETIRVHFQELFRKLFGGGVADIVLEEGVDILESGIEIVARPPGKELRSISLMSGGEKTMAAVALLMAIFRSKPSPFCILDEVDAALDEANVGRFTAVLREFLTLSQFIVITHHKRTMAAADVIFGVTMAEAGVSSKYAVRFEDYATEEVAKAA